MADLLTACLQILEHGSAARFTAAHAESINRLLVALSPEAKPLCAVDNDPQSHIHYANSLLSALMHRTELDSHGVVVYALGSPANVPLATQWSTSGLPAGVSALAMQLEPQKIAFAYPNCIHAALVLDTSGKLWTSGIARSAMSGTPPLLQIEGLDHTRVMDVAAFEHCIICTECICGG